MIFAKPLRAFAALCACALLLTLGPVMPAQAEPGQPPTDELAQSTLPPPLADGPVDEFRLSPDGTQVVFEGRGPGFQATISSVPADGSAGPRLLLTGDTVDAAILAVSNEHAIVYTRAFSEQRWSAGTLFSLALDGSAPPVTLAVEPRYFAFPPVQLAAGGYVVYEVRTLQGDWVVRQLVSARADGGGAPIVHTPAAPGDTLSWALPAADPSRLIVLSGGYGQAPRVLASVPVAGPADARTLLTDASLRPRSFHASVDGRIIAFEADKRLYVVPGDGSAPPRQVAELASPDSFILGYQLSDDGSVVIYQSFTGETPGDYVGTVELFSVPSDGSTPPGRLTPTPIRAVVLYGDPVAMELSPDGRTVAYNDGQALALATVGVADSGRRRPVRTGAAQFEFIDSQRLLAWGGGLAVVPVDPSVEATVLAEREQGARPGVSLLGDRAIFTGCEAGCDSSSGRTLFSVPLAGPPAAAARLATAFRDPGVLRFLPAAGGRAVFSADSDDRPGAELYSVPTNPVGVGLTTSATTIDEGQGLTLTVTLDRAASEPVRAAYQVGGLGSTIRGELVFAAGETSQAISVPLPSDGRFTGDRQVRVTLGRITGAAPLLNDRATVTIRDGEVAQRTWLPLVQRSR